MADIDPEKAKSTLRARLHKEYQYSHDYRGSGHTFIKKSFPDVFCNLVISYTG